MHDLLERIVASKHREVRSCRERTPVERLGPGPEPRDFHAALAAPGLTVIAEIKRRSPSRGALRPDLNPAEVACDYGAHGAGALSVLTDAEHFGGTLDDMKHARQAVDLPVLRKDFVVDTYQLHEARHAGADAVLLIVRVIDDALLRRCCDLARELGMAALVEVHDTAEIRRALNAGATIIGVNNRDLNTLDVDTSTALELRREIPDDCVAVAESGLRSFDDLRRCEEAGFHAVLVGEALMSAADPGDALRRLRSGAQA